MKRTVLATLLGVTMLAGQGLAGQGAAAEQAFRSAVGEYVWNREASNYPQGAYAKDQTMSITQDDGKTISLSQVVNLVDGKSLSWAYSGPYDGQPHRDKWITIALKRISPVAFSNDYVMDDGTKGHEVATLTEKRLTIEGASLDAKGNKQPYVEVWDKVK
jgi:hypothetical protein